MENLPILPITPRQSVKCLPIFVAFDHSGAGHYDAVAKIPIDKPSGETETPDISSEPAITKDYCRCGQGAKKKASTFTSCDKFSKRCKCFQGLKGCNEKCQCLECKNPYGTKDKITGDSKTHAHTRKQGKGQLHK